MKTMSSTIFICIIFLGVSLIADSSALGVLAPEHYERAVQSSAIKAIAIVKDVIVLDETNQSTLKNVIFHLERSFEKDVPQQFAGSCYSVDHKWQMPGVGGIIYHYPYSGSRVLVTISNDGGYITSYTRITSQLENELSKNGLKDISFRGGHISIKNTKMMADPISQAMKFYKNKQYAKAFQKFEPEAQVKNDIAQNYLGHMYFYGLGVEQNYKKAVEWYKKSANQNAPWGIYYLGVAYSQGSGVKKDLGKAFYLFLKAADMGVSKAQYNLGVMYLNGISVEKNLDESFKWIEMAAKQNIPDALYLLGWRYESGMGVKPDMSKAMEYYKKAAALGNEKAIKKADNLKFETQKLFEALYENDLKTVRHQLNKGVNVNAKNDTGRTPLHATQDLTILKMLILHGAKVNSVDGDGQTPMFNKEIDLIKVLIEAGADIHHRSNKGNTLLIWHSYSGYLEGIKYLILLGADVNAKNIDGQTAYDIAERFAHFKLLKYLISIGAQPGEQRPD